MKNLLNFLMACTALVAIASFTACGSKGGGGGVVAGPGPGVIGGGPTGGTVHPSQCQLGQVFVQQYGCLNRQSCQAGYGWIPGENRCVAGTPVTEDVKYGTSYGSRFFGSLQIVNANQFALLMKYAGKCDPYWIGWNAGSYDCKTWTNRGGFIEIRSFGNTNASWNMTIGAGTSNPNTFQPWYANQGYISLSQQAQVVDYNNSQGMQIIGVGGNGQDVGLRARVANGRPTSSSFQMELVFQNVVFARTTVERY